MYETIAVPEDGSPEARTVAEQPRSVAGALDSSGQFPAPVLPVAYPFDVDFVVDIDRTSSRVAELTGDVFGGSTADGTDE
ncbi:hypothetical protein [Natrarchaeobaculum sulfurireducens]|uniref:Uncharacterized protein n=1 Tax=Natrarchaeobaculum sulfurireducens TaxID=2044521 RepID=A0A346PT31_9EURY|nr:hypothetical protein [Natrarchaeobaculum sulfurireducens]AXR82676.1 hypothetical protein AArcMg_2686 [Natrarchaeobaculum sulfurireducens]